MVLLAEETREPKQLPPLEKIRSMLDCFNNIIKVADQDVFANARHSRCKQIKLTIASNDFDKSIVH